MILRYWRGWSTPENAEAYERLARDEILPSFDARGLPGFDGSYLLRRRAGAEIEYAVITMFDSLEGIRSFAGDDHEAAYVPAQVRELLARVDERAVHYEVLRTPIEAREAHGNA
jgi:antibiotic biosynthesis monooxygenase (ABM) superfamily enzyme